MQREKHRQAESIGWLQRSLTETEGIGWLQRSLTETEGVCKVFVATIAARIDTITEQTRVDTQSVLTHEQRR